MKSTDVDLKDVKIDEPTMKVSFYFVCTYCGFKKSYGSLSLEQAGRLVPKIGQAEELASLTGLSVEKMKSYVYPPDVMAQADMERRKIASVSVKSDLKASRQSFPVEKDGWWRVYVLNSRNLEIWFSPDTHSYRIAEAGANPEVVADVINLGEVLLKRLAIAT